MKYLKIGWDDFSDYFFGGDVAMVGVILILIVSGMGGLFSVFFGLMILLFGTAESPSSLYFLLGFVVSFPTALTCWGWLGEHSEENS